MEHPRQTYQATSQQSAFWPGQSPERPSEQQTRQRRFTRRSRKGCLTCKRRRKKCDETHPNCGNCLRVNMCCQWATASPTSSNRDMEARLSSTSTRRESPQLEPEVRSRPSISRSNNNPRQYFTTSGFDMSSPISLISSDSVPSEQRFLLSYYIKKLVPTISVISNSSTYYTALYVPMAFESKGVLNAILASAASHLAKTTADTARSNYFSHHAQLHQLLCHDLLLSRIYEEDLSLRNSNETLAVVLLLIGLETQNGANVKWTKQLKCARQIIAARGGAEHFMNSGWETQSLYRHYLYHDVMASVMEEVHVEEDDSVSRDTSRVSSELTVISNFDASSEKLDPLMGLSSSLFLLIRQISAFHTMPPGIERQETFFRLESAINGWTLNVQDNSASEGLDLAVSLDLIILAESYRLGALILLYRSSTSHRSLLPKIGRRILSFVGRLPDGNQAESGLTYPLFLAGGEFVDWEDMEACALKLRGIRERTKINNIKPVEELLEKVWRVRLNGDDCDWADILREEERIICIA